MSRGPSNAAAHAARIAPGLRRREPDPPPGRAGAAIAPALVGVIAGNRLADVAPRVADPDVLAPFVVTSLPREPRACR